MSHRCIPCFIKQAFIELDGSNMNEQEREEAIRAVLKVLSEHPFDVTPVRIAKRIHDVVISHGGEHDPYHDLKMISSKMIMDRAFDIRERVRSSADPMKEAVICSIAGNVIDYGAKNLFDIDTTLDKAETSGLRIDNYDSFRKMIGSSRKVLYLLDNSGEVVIDGILMEEIRRVNPDISIEAIVKRSPVLNDVTYDDAVYAGISDIDGVKIVELPGDGWVEPELVDYHDDDVIVISKGQGNFESLSDVKGVFFLFVIKCEHVAEFLGVEVGDMVLK